MPIDMQERLSEFSYGYGLTQEFQQAIQAEGLSAVPFFPNLQHEAELGFDVGFNLPGKPLLLQFKLGQAMRRFHGQPRPAFLATRHWRYKIDTAEPGGQYQLLLAAELGGAKVYYAAPKFHDWLDYYEAFEERTLIRDSLFVRPRRIDDLMTTHGVAHGLHKITYDRGNAYLCSNPLAIKPTRGKDIAPRLGREIREAGRTLGESMEALFAGLWNRLENPVDSERADLGIKAEAARQARRLELFERNLVRMKSRERAIAATIAAEAWALGAELMMVTQTGPGQT